MVAHHFHFHSARPADIKGDSPPTPSMLDELGLACEAATCDRLLSETDQMLIYRTAGGERRVYECACGAITISVTR